MKRTKANVTYLDQDPELTAAWDRDRQLQRRVPPGEAYRGCMGLAMLYRNAEHAINHGDACLLPNDHIRWLALRDVPPGHFPTSPPMNRRGVHLATATVARLRYGMPVIDFTDRPRDTWDFGFRPFATARRQYGPARWQYHDVQAGGDTLHAGKDAREFAILNRLSAAMTRFAFYAREREGSAVRPAWRAVRPRDGARAESVVRPLDWCPRAHLAFRESDVHHLFGAIGKVRVRESPSGCERCGRERQRAQVVGIRVGPQVPIAVKKSFTEALAAGLPLVTTDPCVYVGSVPQVAGPDDLHLPVEAGARLALVAHHFRSDVTGEHMLTYLPTTARVLAEAGQHLDGGSMWAYGLRSSPAAEWRALDRLGRWVGRADACGGSAAAELLLHEWLRQQAVRCPDAPGIVLMPAHLIAWAVHTVEPVGLFWDVAPTMPFDVAGLEAAVFPPLRARRWRHLRFRMPGDVDLNASIIDPRLRPATTISAGISVAHGVGQRAGCRVNVPA